MLMVDGVEMPLQISHQTVEEEECSITILMTLMLLTPLTLLQPQPLQLLAFMSNLIQEPLLVKLLLDSPLPLLV